MKKLFLPFICSLTFISQVFAQETPQTQYLFSDKNVHFSGFGGPTVQFGIVDGNFAVYNGGGGGALINQKFFIGGAGEGLSTSHSFPEIAQSQTDHTAKYQGLELNVGYGGLWLGYIHKSYNVVHWGLSTKFGPGAISLFDRDYPTDKYQEIASDFVFVISPQLELEVNMARWFKMNFAAGYKLFTGIDDKTYFNTDGQEVKYYTPSMFNTPYFSIGFYFGWFDLASRKSKADKD